MHTEIKICGLTQHADIEAVNADLPEYAGFVFFEKSRRNITYSRAKELLQHLDERITPVAVCVSPTAEEFRNLEALGVGIIQIHGEVPMEALEEGACPVWQAVNIKEEIQPEQFCRHPRITGYVIDGADYGSGKTFGWEEQAAADWMRQNLTAALADRKFILAGGLQIDNVALGIERLEPDVVDISSGVETNQKKDAVKINTFIRKVREQ